LNTHRPAGAARDATAFAVSAAIILLALVVLVGWHAHIRAAVRIFGGPNAMHYNSALAFVALGAAGIGLSTGRRLLLLCGGGFALLMGAAAIVEYATGASLGIDTLFLYPWESPVSVNPGRMPLTTAISFALTGGALVTLARRQEAYAVLGVVTSVPLSLALTSLVGYVFQISYVLPFNLGAQMALHSSIAFLAYSIAMLRHAWQHAERGPDGLPTWSAGIGVALLPVLFVGATALFPEQSWRVVVLEAALSSVVVALFTLAIRALITAKVAYKGLLLIALPLILLLTFVGLAVHVKRQSDSAQALARHSAEVISVSRSLLLHTVETESAVRGYLLTGDRGFLASYEQSLAVVTETATRLRALVSDNRPQEARVSTIEQLVLRRTGRLFHSRGPSTPAEPAINEDTGAELMTRVRAEVDAFSREEERLGVERQVVLDTLWQRLRWLLVAGTSGSIVLATILTLSFSGGISQRLRQLRNNAINLAAGKALTPPLTGHDEIAELDGVFHAMAASLDEVTKREKAVIEGATDGIVVKDLEHRYVMVNQGSAQLLGKTVAEVVGATIYDLYEPETARRISEFDDQILAGGKAATYELPAAIKGGETRIYSSTYSPYRDRHGVLVGVITISRDITEQKRAEGALIESERRFRELFYDAPVGYHELDTEGRITGVNTTELSMLGYSRDDMVGHFIWEFIEAPEHARRIFDEWLAGTTPLRSVEHSVRCKDGGWVAVQVDVRMLKDPNGIIVGIRATVQDIRERKQAEALIKAGALQSAIFNSANFSSIATDARGVIQIFNVGAERMLGYTAGDVTNRITPADISDPAEVIARARALSAELGTPITPGFEALVFKASRGIEDIYELTYIRKDGSRLPAVVSVTALRDAAGAIIGYLLIGTDNTARRQVEEERQKLAQRLRDQHFYTRSLIESNIDALMTCDPAGMITDVNKQAETLTGRTRDELIGAPFKNCFTDPGLAETGINRVLSEGKVTDYELTARASNGALTVVSCNATTFYDRDRRLQGVFAAARDVTEVKRFERTLQQKNDELEDASRMKSDFLANMSHELRTPLNAIIGFSEVLRDGLMGDLTDKQRGFIGDIYGSGKHLLSLINDILDLSKVEAGKMMLDLEPVPLSSLFENSLSVIREQALARRIRVELDLGAVAALGSMQMDPRKVKQILYNLLSNAVKFTPEGGLVTVRASRVPRADVGRRCGLWTGRNSLLADNGFAEFFEIRVLDNGIGVSREGLDRLFRPFSQIDSGLARKFEGTGLGLAMVKLLAELHGGAVAVESAAGEGSCFTVWLPLRAPEERALPAATAPPDLGIEAPIYARTALVVEDDLKSADLIRVQLEAEGFAVLHAVSAEAALVLAVQQPLALITVDILLPNMDGWEFLSRIKQVPELQRIPVVIISIVADRMKGFSLGAAAVMQKPISRQELYESLVDLGLFPVSEGHSLKVLIVDDDPKAVELVAVRIMGLASTVLRAYGGREAIATAGRERPDLIVLDLMMPEVNGFDVVEALHEQRNTASIPIVVVTAMAISAEDRAKLNGSVTAIMEKAKVDRDRFRAEVRRAMSGRPVPA